MLPLVSKTKPIERGASSLAKWTIFCSPLSSKTLKFSFSRPVTKRFSGSVTVTLIRTTVVSTRMSLRGPLAAGAVGLALGSTVTLGLSAHHPGDAINALMSSSWGSNRWIRDVIGPSHSSFRVYQKLNYRSQKTDLAGDSLQPVGN